MSEDLKPLIKVASGGEISRIMLAIKSIMASNDEIPTLIFDEIDARASYLKDKQAAINLDNIQASINRVNLIK